MESLKEFKKEILQKGITHQESYPQQIQGEMTDLQKDSASSLLHG